MIGTIIDEIQGADKSDKFFVLIYLITFISLGLLMQFGVIEPPVKSNVSMILSGDFKLYFISYLGMTILNVIFIANLIFISTRLKQYIARIFDETETNALYGKILIRILAILIFLFTNIILYFNLSVVVVSIFIIILIFSGLNSILN
jgi:hypothetical protein